MGCFMAMISTDHGYDLKSLATATEKVVTGVRLGYNSN